MKKPHTLVKKFVIHPDKLPAKFPHHIVIYLMLINHFSDWNIWLLIGSSLVFILMSLSYAYRKTIEIYTKDRL